MPQRKKILFLSHVSNLGGAEQVLLTTARHINSEKFCCELLTQEDGPLCEQFRATGGETFTLKLPAWRKGKYFLSRYITIHRLAKICRQREVDVIHCNNYRIAPYAIGAARKCEIPFVVHVHDPLEKKHIRNFKLTHCPDIIAVSDFVRQPMGEQGLDPRIVYNGVDVNRLRTTQQKDIRQEAGWDKDTKVIGWVANFTQNKRPDLFIQLAAAMIKERPEYRFVIVGHDAWGGPVTREGLEKMSEDRGLAGQLAFLGWRNDIPHLLKSFDGIVLCSEKESFPLIVLEAMACGCIVFAQGTAGGPAEQIEDGRDGFSLDFIRVDESAAKIISVLDDQDQMKAVREQALKKVRERFDLSSFILQMEEILLTVQ